MEGFNVRGNHETKKTEARIGFISNEQNDCLSCDSRTGFGTARGNDDKNTCGNACNHVCDAGVSNFKAFGYILVQ